MAQFTRWQRAVGMFYGLLMIAGVLLFIGAVIDSFRWHPVYEYPDRPHP